MKKLIILCLIAVVAGIPMGIALELVLESALQKRGGYYDFYVQDMGNIKKYDIRDHTLVAYLDDSLNDEDVVNTTKALEELDDILIYDTISIVREQPTNEHYVHVSKCHLEDNLYGLAIRQEPYLVKIDNSISNSYWKDDKVSVFGKVIQHEFGHVLGLIDLEDEKYKETSVMYCSYTGAHRYTELDIKNIQAVYC